MSRNRIVQTPEKKMARFGSRPMTIGNTKVAPNIATTCWAPIPTVLPQGSRSSGATGSPGAGVTSRQLNIVDIWILLWMKGAAHLDLVTHITHPGGLISAEERRTSPPAPRCRRRAQPLAWEG